MSIILFYDSGVGGISTLNATIARLKSGSYIYYADNLNCPYGDKTQKEVEGLVKERLNWLLKRFKVEMVVFACNTITTSCIDKMRASFNLPFVGTEPAIRPAMAKSKHKQILVVATEATIRQKRLMSIAKSVGGRVFLLPLPGLADRIEEGMVTGTDIDLGPFIDKIKRVLSEHKNIDGIVLGCTHYSFIKKRMEEEVKLPCYDGNDGVARRIEHLLKEKTSGQGRVKVRVIVSSGEPKTLTMYRKMVMKIKV